MCLISYIFLYVLYNYYYKYSIDKLIDLNKYIVQNMKLKYFLMKNALLYIYNSLIINKF